MAIRRAGFDSSQEEEKMLNILLQDPDTMHRNDSRTPFLAQALAALLASVSPLLESLNLCFIGMEHPKLLRQNRQSDGAPFPETDYFFKHFLDRVNSGSQKTMPFLENLRKVRFLVDAEENIWEWFYYQPHDLYGSVNLVRRLPGVESVQFDGIFEEENVSVIPPPRSANYTKITIRNSNMDLHHLVRIIESARRLEEFTYAVGGRASRDGVGLIKFFSLEHVLRALLLHGESLLHLDLDMEGDISLTQIFQPYDFDDDDPPPSSDPAYHHEWAEELQTLETDEHPVYDWSSPCTLRGLPKLKNLSLGIHLLYYLARGIGGDQVEEEEASFAIVDHLPPNIESLCIYGYEKGMKPYIQGLPLDVFDRQLEKLLAEKDTKLPRLTYIEGIDELIVNAFTVAQPHHDHEDLWERGTDDNWTNHEYDC
ncbi:uncharacterized protein BHQ10_005299 [Talaromyces amestolkiae]|uniref:Uncharacterized protein n=1 Tax=Talaromyces amestolkiae TaxID=1196081 RepID=A0A364L0E4_TALAM|nr:uncharacterized protein BHQ10_005299 [Talaromyces amestolkiae]RAO69287.1 hypothetical protein BHQ10_005299 [Talaromyces amestolkiae]